MQQYIIPVKCELTDIKEEWAVLYTIRVRVYEQFCYKDILCLTTEYIDTDIDFQECLQQKFKLRKNDLHSLFKKNLL